MLAGLLLPVLLHRFEKGDHGFEFAVFVDMVTLEKILECRNQFGHPGDNHIDIFEYLPVGCLG